MRWQPDPDHAWTRGIMNIRDGSELNKVDIVLIYRHNTCTIIMISLNLPRRRHLCMQQPYRFWVLTEVLDSQYGNAPIHNGIFRGIFNELCYCSYSITCVMSQCTSPNQVNTYGLNDRGDAVSQGASSM